MNMTVEQLLNALLKPENADAIKHLAHLENLEHLEDLRDIPGIGGFISKLVLKATKNHTNAFIELSQCTTAEDIAAFMQTPAYDKVKSTQIGDNLDIGSLEKLQELSQLQNIGDQFN